MTTHVPYTHTETRVTGEVEMCHEKKVPYPSDGLYSWFRTLRKQESRGLVAFLRPFGAGFLSLAGSQRPSVVSYRRRRLRATGFLAGGCAVSYAGVGRHRDRPGSCAVERAAKKNGNDAHLAALLTFKA